MYYLLAASLMFTIVYSDRLENTYLPPNRAQSAGGNGAFLKTPIRTAPPSQLYGAASGSFSGSAAGNINVAAKGNFGPTSPPIAILRLNNENNGDGKYAFDFETENHITQQESGQLKNEDNFAAQGSYSFQAPDGHVYSINYIADENGFQAQGEHIPTAPPVPAEILKALEQNAADEAAGIVDDGQYRPDPSEGYQGNKYLARKTGPAPSPNNGGYRY